MNKIPTPIIWTDEKVKLFWDHVSIEPDQYFTYQQGKELKLEFAPYLNAGINILDYGSGPGHFITQLLETGAFIYATDFSNDSLNKLNNRFKDSNNFKGSFLIEDIDKIDTKFDVIFLFEVIEHLSDEHLSQLSSNLKHLLKKGGKIIMTTPNDENLKKSEICCPECLTTYHKWQHMRSWNTNTLKSYFETKGFIIEKCYTTNFTRHRKPGKVATLKKWIDVFSISKRKPVQPQKDPNLVVILTQ